MNGITLPRWMSSMKGGSALAAPIIIVLLLSMMILPLLSLRARRVLQL
ncbi:hypothetical protein LP419_28630 [Massilia sp. H-1]|nr:hypothetical protein LP419_28630 [Massilia sp. H-1]